MDSSPNTTSKKTILGELRFFKVFLRYGGLKHVATRHFSKMEVKGIKGMNKNDFTAPTQSTIGKAIAFAKTMLCSDEC
jgi:hypothetical protein